MGWEERVAKGCEGGLAILTPSRKNSSTRMWGNNFVCVFKMTFFSSAWIHSVDFAFKCHRKSVVAVDQHFLWQFCCQKAQNLERLYYHARKRKSLECFELNTEYHSCENKHYPMLNIHCTHVIQSVNPYGIYLFS